MFLPGKYNLNTKSKAKDVTVGTFEQMMCSRTIPLNKFSKNMETSACGYLKGKDKKTCWTIVIISTIVIIVTRVLWFISLIVLFLTQLFLIQTVGSFPLPFYVLDLVLTSILFIAFDTSLLFYIILRLDPLGYLTEEKKGIKLKKSSVLLGIKLAYFIALIIGFVFGLYKLGFAITKIVLTFRCTTITSTSCTNNMNIGQWIQVAIDTLSWIGLLVYLIVLIYLEKKSIMTLKSNNAYVALKMKKGSSIFKNIIETDDEARKELVAFAMEDEHLQKHLKIDNELELISPPIMQNSNTLVQHKNLISQRNIDATDRVKPNLK